MNVEKKIDNNESIGKGDQIQENEIGVSQIIELSNPTCISIIRNQILDLGVTRDINELNMLLKSIEDKDDYTRCIAAKCLGKFCDPVAVNILIKSLKDESSAVRKQSALALGRLGDIRSRPYLIDALKDEDRSVRKAAKKSLSKIDRSCLISNTVSEKAIVESNGININPIEMDNEIQGSSAKPVEPIYNLKNKNIKIDIKREPIDLGKKGQLGCKNMEVEALLSDLDNSDLEKRKTSIRLLGNRIHEGDSYAVDALIKALGNECTYVRFKAANYLGIIKDIKSLGSLEYALKTNTGFVRKKIKESIKLINAAESDKIAIDEKTNKNKEISKSIMSSRETETASSSNIIPDQIAEESKDTILGVKSLLADLDNSDLEKRKASIRLLGNRIHEGDSYALDALIKALDDESTYVRLKAAGYLGILKDKRSIDPLELALKTNTGLVRKKIKDSIKLINVANLNKIVDNIVVTDKNNINNKNINKKISERTMALMKPENTNLSNIMLTQIAEKSSSLLSRSETLVNVSERANVGGNGKNVDSIEIDDTNPSTSANLMPMVLQFNSECVNNILVSKKIEPSSFNDKEHPECGSMEVESLLVDLSDSDTETRIKSMRLLRNRIREGDSCALDALIRALNDESMYIRFKAADYLGILKDQRSIDSLEFAFKTNTGSVRMKIKEAIELINAAESNKSADKSVKIKINSSKKIELDKELEDGLKTLQKTEISSLSNKMPFKIAEKTPSLQTLYSETSALSDKSHLPIKDQESPRLKRKVLTKPFERVPNYYILQVDSQNYDIFNAIESLEVITYEINPNSVNVQAGDRAYLWEYQCQSIVATATVISNPRNLQPEDEEVQFFKSKRPGMQILIQLKIDVLINPITKDIIISNHGLDRLPIFDKSRKNTISIINEKDAKMIDSLKIEKYISDQRQPDLSDQREPDSSDQRKPDSSDQREPDLSDQSQPDLSDQRQPDLSDQRQPYLSDQRQPDLSDQRQPDLSDQRQPDLSDQRQPDLSDQREPDLSDQREPDLSDQRKPDLSDQKEPQYLKENSKITLEDKILTIDLPQKSILDCRGKSPIIISIINLKCGVGKTSIAIALADFMAGAYNKKVLLIDLDPQTNATVNLIKDKIWLEKNDKGETIYQLFKDKLDRTNKFDANKSIIDNVYNLDNSISNFSLLPSSIDLIKIQDSLSKISADHFYLKSPITILKDATSDIIDKYDFVLIDCPPDLGIITLNGIYISDYYLIPTIPNYLSTWGIPQIIDGINEFKEETGISVTPLGIVISMYCASSNLHDAIIDRLNKEAISGKYPRILDTKIPLKPNAEEAIEYDSALNFLWQKYGYGSKNYHIYDNLAKEVLNYTKK